jgi:two-component system NtrC family sensor kinase
MRDTGHGISAEKLNRIFDPFYTTKAIDRGTGLGLSVCLGIIRQHHGEISVKSVPGEGTVFRLLLPLAQTDMESDPTTSMEPARQGSQGPLLETVGELPRLNVLVIDDEEYITSLVQESLRDRFGWRVERVHDGRQAIQRLENVPFDLVITDLRMPGLDGFAIIRWIRDSKPALLPRVLVITGDSGGPSMDQELLDLGVQALRKPFTPHELVAQCQVTLTRS